MQVGDGSWTKLHITFLAAASDSPSRTSGVAPSSPAIGWSPPPTTGRQGQGCSSCSGMAHQLCHVIGQSPLDEAAQVAFAIERIRSPSSRSSPTPTAPCCTSRMGWHHTPFPSQSLGGWTGGGDRATVVNMQNASARTYQVLALTAATGWVCRRLSFHTPFLTCTCRERERETPQYEVSRGEKPCAQ